MELKPNILKTCKKRNIEILDIEEGILKCKICGKHRVRKMTTVFEESWVKNEGSEELFPNVKMLYKVDWPDRVPAGWWKCPVCWQAID